MTQDLAAKAGISWHFVSSIERGIKTGTLETLAATVAARDVMLSELFLDIDRPLPRELKRHHDSARVPLPGDAARGPAHRRGRATPSRP